MSGAEQIVRQEKKRRNFGKERYVEVGGGKWLAQQNAALCLNTGFSIQGSAWDYLEIQGPIA